MDRMTDARLAAMEREVARVWARGTPAAREWIAALFAEVRRARKAEERPEPADAEHRIAEIVLATHPGLSCEEAEARAACALADAPVAGRDDPRDALLSRLVDWTHQHGKALCPPDADTYGEGMRDAKTQVGRMIASALADAPHNCVVSIYEVIE